MKPHNNKTLTTLVCTLLVLISSCSNSYLNTFITKMMKPFRQILSLLFVLVSFISFAQDFIVKKDTTIYCKIRKEDSLTIFYTDRADERRSVSKTDVYKYFNSATRKIKNGFLVQRSAIDYFTFARLNNDSIIITKNNKIDYRGERFTKGETINLMKLNNEARHDAKKARVSRLFGTLLFIDGLFFVGDFMIGASYGEIYWINGVHGIVALVIAVTLQQAFHKQFTRAIKKFNTKPNNLTGTHIPKIELGLASKGIGLCLKF